MGGWLNDIEAAHNLLFNVITRGEDTRQREPIEKALRSVEALAREARNALVRLNPRVSDAEEAKSLLVRNKVLRVTATVGPGHPIYLAGEISLAAYRDEVTRMYTLHNRSWTRSGGPEFQITPDQNILINMMRQFAVIDRWEVVL
jgi:hypothetical protein